MEPAHANESIPGPDDLRLTCLFRRDNYRRRILKVAQAFSLSYKPFSDNYEHDRDLDLDELRQRCTAPWLRFLTLRSLSFMHNYQNWELSQDP